MTNTTTIQSDKGPIEIRTRPVGKTIILAQAFHAAAGRAPIWQQDCPAGTDMATIEADCRAYLTDNTSLFDGVA